MNLADISEYQSCRHTIDLKVILSVFGKNVVHERSLTFILSELYENVTRFFQIERESVHLKKKMNLNVNGFVF